MFWSYRMFLVMELVGGGMWSVLQIVTDSETEVTC